MDNETTSFYKATANVEAVDAGLRQYMQNVFLYMSAGLGLTALISYLVAGSQFFVNMLHTSPGLLLILGFVELGLVLYLSLRITSMSTQQARVIFYIYSIVNGISLAPIFLCFTGTSVASTFFVTASMFLAMAIYGYATDKDLTSFGSLLVMVLIGMVVASIVNIFLHSSTMSLILSAVGVIVFTGLTAYDTQKIKSMYFEGDTADIHGKKSILGALTLYLDFINLFISLLRFLGVRRDN